MGRIYAMDFDLVTQEAEKLSKTASNMTGIVTKGSTNRTNNLSEWKGQASTTYDDSTTTKENNIKQDADVLNGLSSYLLEAKHAVESNEEFLSQIKI